MIGRVFSPFELDIRQTVDEVWGTDADFPAWANPLAVTTEGGDGCGPLFVGVASRNKDVAASMEAFITRHCPGSPRRLVLTPPNSPLAVDNELCRAMVSQTYAAIESTMRGQHVSSIHLFAAAPQAFMMMLGREFKGMPPVHLHEWTGTKYVESVVLPGAVP